MKLLSGWDAHKAATRKDGWHIASANLVRTMVDILHQAGVENVEDFDLMPDDAWELVGKMLGISGAPADSLKNEARYLIDKGR